MSIGENGIRFNFRETVRISSNENSWDKSDQGVIKRREEKRGPHPRKAPAVSPTREQGLSPSSMLNCSQPPEKAEIDLLAGDPGSGTADKVLARGDRSEELFTYIYREKLKTNPSGTKSLEESESSRSPSFSPLLGAGPPDVLC